MVKGGWRQLLRASEAKVSGWRPEEVAPSFLPSLSIPTALTMCQAQVEQQD